VEFKNKVALVTGGSRGIGEGVCQSLAEKGASIAFFYRVNSEAAQKTKKILSSYGVKVASYQVDVTDYEQVVAGVSDVKKEFGRIDILVNNAGRSPSINYLVDVSLKEWNNVINLDLTGVFFCCKAVVPIMRGQKCGNIINISSIVGSNCQEFSASYAAAKAGVNALTMVLAKEEGRNGLRVNCIAPGFVQTRMAARMVEAMGGEEVVNRELAKLPLTGMRGYPEDIGNAVVFLASEKSKYMTGQIIHIDGGSWMSA